MGAYFLREEKNNKMNTLKLVIVGDVDHGKSTLIGRMLFDTGSLPYDKIKEVLGGASKEKNFAHFLDSFQEEREKEMTVDTTQVFLGVKKRKYTIIDAPGHKEFIKNMITGAAYAKIGVLVVDVREGLKEQSRRHALLLSLLGIEKVIVAVNKMDLANYNEHIFNKLKKEIEDFFAKIDIPAIFFVPVSALKGENIVKKPKKMLWYKGPSLLEAINSLEIEGDRVSKELIFSVQDVYLREKQSIAVGRVESGMIKAGDPVKVLPEGYPAKVKSINKFLEKTQRACQGECVGLTFEDDIFLKRGDILCDPQKVPSLANKFKANIFLFEGALGKEEQVTLQCGTQQAGASIEEIQESIDPSLSKTLNKDASLLEFLDMSKVILKTFSPLMIKKSSEQENLSRFVLMKDGIIFAGGVVVEVF